MDEFYELEEQYGEGNRTMSTLCDAGVLDARGTREDLGLDPYPVPNLDEPDEDCPF
jgi:hypothetical protein